MSGEEATGFRRTLAEPAFADDDGRADATLAVALGDDERVVACFGDARVFVPIVAVVGEQATDGSDKSADMAAVLMTGKDGRTALLAFSSVDALADWDRLARPVAVWGRDAIRAARDEGASAVLLDLGSDHFTVLEVGTA